MSLSPPLAHGFLRLLLLLLLVSEVTKQQENNLRLPLILPRSEAFLRQRVEPRTITDLSLSVDGTARPLVVAEDVTNATTSSSAFL